MEIVQIIFPELLEFIYNLKKKKKIVRYFNFTYKNIKDSPPPMLEKSRKLFFFLNSSNYLWFFGWKIHFFERKHFHTLGFIPLQGLSHPRVSNQKRKNFTVFEKWNFFKNFEKWKVFKFLKSEHFSKFLKSEHF